MEYFLMETLIVIEFFCGVGAHIWEETETDWCMSIQWLLKPLASSQATILSCIQQASKVACYAVYDSLLQLMNIHTTRIVHMVCILLCFDSSQFYPYPSGLHH